LDGVQHHRGLEANADARWSAWSVGLGLSLLDARRSSSLAAFNNQRPTNVPQQVLRLQTQYRVTAVEGLRLLAHLSHEGRRAVLPDNSIMLPAWSRLDIGAMLERRLGGVATTWRLNIDNLADKRFFKESPYQFGHAYLFTGVPRTVRLSVTAAL
jgi:iron complex outermembrane recepter protein